MISKVIPLEQCFCHGRLAAYQSRVPKIPLQGYTHHSCRSIYELRSTLDQGNPGKIVQELTYYYQLAKPFLYLMYYLIDNEFQLHFEERLTDVSTNYLYKVAMQQLLLSSPSR